MSIIVNPGSGPVPGATQEQAHANMRVFVEECRQRYGGSWGLVTTFEPKDMNDGRWEYIVGYGEQRTFEVEMPGLPIERVRWLSEESGSIWDFPRLYVDGSSWIWAFALNAMDPAEQGQ